MENNDQLVQEVIRGRRNNLERSDLSNAVFPENFKKIYLKLNGST